MFLELLALVLTLQHLQRNFIQALVTLTADATLAGSTITNSSTITGATFSLTETGNSVINGAISGVNIFSVSGTTTLGANVSTTGTQTYTGAVTVTGTAATRTITTTADTITFGSTVDSSALGANNLTFGAGSGNAVFTGAVGGATNGATGTITGIASQQLTFSDGVAATTIANYGTLLFQASSDKTVSAAITDNGTTTIQVINSADGAPGIITFTGNVAADTITIGTTTKAGSALFNGTVTGTNINIVGGEFIRSVTW
jgi:hypothetical protein